MEVVASVVEVGTEAEIDNSEPMDISHLLDGLILSDKTTQTISKESLRTKFIEKVTADNTSCLYWTGLSSLTLLNYVYEWVLPCAKETPIWMGKKRHEIRSVKDNSNKPLQRKRVIGHWQEYLLTLIRIRRGMDVRELATLFDIHHSYVSKVFITWINILYKCLGQLMEWPKAEYIKASMPPSFKNLFPSTRAIVDCSEIYVQTPRNLDAQKETYSSYKSHNTFKFFLAIAPSGQVTFLSKLFSGSIGDRDIVEQCGFLDLI